MDYKSEKILTLQEYLDETYTLIILQEKRMSFRKRAWRYLIRNNELTCVASGKKVAYCSYDYKESSRTYHYNFYSEDGVLFTIDHKIPLSQGGINRMTNIQPMVLDENHNKGNQLIYI